MARLETICIVDECIKVSGVPGTARGMCVSHYQRWKKWGDPLADHRRKRTFCAIDGCEKPCAGRGLCGAHWYHWKTYGDPARTFSRRVNPGEGRQVCSRCRVDLPLSEFSPSKQTVIGYCTYCRACSRINTAEWRAAHPDYVPPPRDPVAEARRSAGYKRRNPDIVTAYRERTRDRTRAYAKEWRKRNPEATRTHATARRARRRMAYVEPVSPNAVYRRDGWCCRICLKSIDPAIANPDPMSASIDHIVPLARHGKHSMANVQAAHLVCNMRKGVKDFVAVNHF